MNQGRTIILIDGANIDHAARALGFNIDWSRFRKYFSEKMNVLRFYYYTALIEGEDWMFRLTDWLQYNGYCVRSKPAKPRGETYRGDLDLEIAVDALSLPVGSYDQAILLSGDGDFRCLVEALQFRGVKVTVCHTRRANKDQQTAALDLVKQADEFLDLVGLKPYIEKQGPASNGDLTPAEVSRSD